MDRTLNIKLQNKRDSVSSIYFQCQKRMYYVSLGLKPSHGNYHLPFLFSERDAIDVENANDYHEMVANLANSEPDKIKILVDMKAIRSSCRRVQNASDDEDDLSANEGEVRVRSTFVTMMCNMLPLAG
jgi:hypothetical protein